jgi:hypothetical protein
MKNRSLCQGRRAEGYNRRIKPVLEDNGCQMKSCIISKIHQSMTGGRKEDVENWVVGFTGLQFGIILRVNDY